MTLDTKSERKRNSVTAQNDPILAGAPDDPTVFISPSGHKAGIRNVSSL